MVSESTRPNTIVEHCISQITIDTASLVARIKKCNATTKKMHEIGKKNELRSSLYPSKDEMGRKIRSFRRCPHLLWRKASPHNRETWRFCSSYKPSKTPISLSLYLYRPLYFLFNLFFCVGGGWSRKGEMEEAYFSFQVHFLVHWISRPPPLHSS